MAQHIGRDRTRVCVYPRMYGLPLGIFFLSVIIIVVSIIISLALQKWNMIIFAATTICAIYMINRMYAGNLGWSKKRPHHQYVKTGLFISHINRIIKIKENETKDKTLVRKA